MCYKSGFYGDFIDPMVEFVILSLRNLAHIGNLYSTNGKRCATCVCACVLHVKHS